jgi:hypothetical protein
MLQDGYVVDVVNDSAREATFTIKLCFGNSKRRRDGKGLEVIRCNYLEILLLVREALCTNNFMLLFKRNVVQRLRTVMLRICRDVAG